MSQNSEEILSADLISQSQTQIDQLTNNNNSSESIPTMNKKRKRKASPAAQIVDQTVEQVRKEFLIFLKNFKNEGETTPHFLSQAASMAQNMTTTLQISVSDLMLFNQDLAVALIEEYSRFKRAIQKAAQDFMRSNFPEHLKLDDRDQERMIFLSFNSIAGARKIRGLKTEQLGQLISISGTVTRTSEVRPELLFGCFSCNICGALAKEVEQQYVYTEPVRCANLQCDNRSSWELEMAESVFADWQRVRLQENADEIPAGSIPRHLDVVLRNEEVEKVKPGDKCDFSGCLVVLPDTARIYGGVESAKVGGRKPDPNYQGVVGLKTLGVRSLTYRLAFIANHVELAEKELESEDLQADSEESRREAVLGELSPQEKHDILAMSETPNVYQRLARSIAPDIFGHEEVKKGILLMLLGGVQKETFDGIKLRGDINLCIVGDPSTAKSQFLKYVCSFMPRAIYTSGKASSAAGLTASVAKDVETGEFGIEAGALMLADSGVCCIDEFDKMDPRDQAAIHEAMEQQTISITKAGISATLNARASILAAANPVYGRYDLARTLRDNIDISAAIMSRFDLFFVITDVCDEGTDYSMARHIVNLHQGKEPQQTQPDFSAELMRNYIRYARTIKPRLSKEAKKLAVVEYKELRQADAGGAKSAYRITVRQLESVVRLSEALARAELKDFVLSKHVREAVRLLRKSILPIETSNIDLVSEELNTTSVPSQITSSESTKTKSLSFEEYKKLSNLFVHYIRKKEKSSEVWTGLFEKDLMEWYLEQGNDSGLFSGEKEADEALNTARAVVNRLIKVDNVLIVLEEPELVTEENRGKRLIDVHPNFDPDTAEIEASQTTEVGGTQSLGVDALAGESVGEE